MMATRAACAEGEEFNNDGATALNVLGVRVDPVDVERALARVVELLFRRQKGYVCAVSVHGVLEARRNPHVAQAFAEAALVIPDGRPMVWVGRMQGHRGIRQVTGPDLMRAIFSRPEFAGCSHFFYGGKPGVAEDLAARWTRQFREARIVGTYTPPFRDLTPAEETEVVEILNKAKPDLVWVGISTPRQELLMRRLLPCLDDGVLLGVGAAFDFHTGRIRDCAPWIKRLGFQWLHRLMQDPRRLWRRNLRNMSFLWHIALQLTGLKTCENRPKLLEEMRVGSDQPASATSNSSVAGSA
jgi:N-acetylglucosaminyldiphosphoundecaprenol N-acetyl-beta-D-mannosaminyltransferase